MSAALARRLVVGLAGADLTTAEAAWLAHYRPAGVILFARNCVDYAQVVRLCRQLRALVPGLEIMADHEGGPVSQLARAIGRPPVGFALGRLDDEALTAKVHRETGQRLRAAGLTRVLAPVADVLTAPRNPVIGARAFGADADLVARHTAAAVRGLTEAGLSVCLKHWPGHGGGTADTHLQAALAGSGAVAKPFEAGLSVGADAVMIGHLGLDDRTKRPATLDAAFLADTRQRLAGRTRPVLRLVADDVTMGALRPAMAALGVEAGDGQTGGMVAPETLPLAWLEALMAAGCDELLIRGLPWRALPLPSAASGAEGERARVAAAQETDAEPRFDPRPYAEARHRSWGVVPEEFADPGQTLAWWDLTAGDRWQVAGGDMGSAQENLGPRLRTRFAGVADWRPEAPGPLPVTRLLVTSHRPLPEPLPKGADLAERGLCVVMGHPSLGPALEGYLGRGWRVGALYDVHDEDLFAEA